MSSRERRDGSYHRRRRYSDDYDSELELYQQYKAAGLDTKLLRTVQTCILLTVVQPKSFGFANFGSIFPLMVTQTYLSDEDDDLYLSPVLRKKAVKVKHVKRREKKFDKKVSAASSFIIVIAQ